jgi:thiamine-phosphate pyrophosphorylase
VNLGEQSKPNGGGGEARCRLYLITPPVFEPARFAEDLARALDAGDVGALQIRFKDAPDDDAVRRAVDALRPIAQARGVAVILNDRADLALETGCDGAHLGQADGNHAAARRLLGPERTLGITCHASRHLAMEAGEAGADYVAFGAFYPTTTKPSHYRPHPSILSWWSALFEIPCVAIGGITPDNARPLIDAGADFVAVCQAVWGAEDPAAAVKRFNEVLAL